MVAPMIVSASRRTDIPAFYAQWFIRRVRAGFCTVANPFNPHQVSRVSLEPEAVDAVVFWTRYPAPLMPYLSELDHLGIPYYFLFTLVDYPRILEPRTPTVGRAVEVFRELADGIGAGRVVWRYDPVVLGPCTTVDYHLQRFSRLAQALSGATERVVLSVMDLYKKLNKRLRGLADKGFVAGDETQLSEGELERLILGLAGLARSHGMELQTCAEELPFEVPGVVEGKCVDDELLAKECDVQVEPGKDPRQRGACRCVVSKDIGAYDTCPFGCAYCYAVRSFERARRRYREHDPDASSL